MTLVRTKVTEVTRLADHSFKKNIITRLPANFVIINEIQFSRISIQIQITKRRVLFLLAKIIGFSSLQKDRIRGIYPFIGIIRVIYISPHKTKTYY